MKKINISLRTDQELDRIDAMAVLPEQVRDFVLSYIKLGNGKKAAIRAGYDASIANNISTKLLNQSKKVRKAIRTCIALECERFDASEDSIVKALTLIVNGNMSDYLTWDEFNVVKLIPKRNLSPEQLYAVEEISRTVQGGLKVKIKDKLKALESLAKIKGMFHEKKDITITSNTPSHLSSDYDIEKLEVKELRILRKLLKKCKIEKKEKKVVEEVVN